MHECVIGVLGDFDDTKTVTFTQLKKEIEDDIELYAYAGQRSPFCLSDYLDRRKSTALEHFDYCPKCGKKIDWKGLRKKQGG